MKWANCDIFENSCYFIVKYVRPEVLFIFNFYNYANDAWIKLFEQYQTNKNYLEIIQNVISAGNMLFFQYLIPFIY